MILNIAETCNVGTGRAGDKLSSSINSSRVPSSKYIENDILSAGLNLMTCSISHLNVQKFVLFSSALSTGTLNSDPLTFLLGLFVHRVSLTIASVFPNRT